MHLFYRVRRGSWKVPFSPSILKDWKVLENGRTPWKILEIWKFLEQVDPTTEKYLFECYGSWKILFKAWKSLRSV